MAKTKRHHVPLAGHDKTPAGHDKKIFPLWARVWSDFGLGRTLSVMLKKYNCCQGAEKGSV
jgi:hypothetical protein